MSTQLSAVSKFSIWYVVCVSLGLTLAANDGIPTIVVAGTALTASVLLVIGLFVAMFLRRRKNQ